MKKSNTCLLGILVLFGFANCANSKKIQTEPPFPLQQAYYTTWAEDRGNTGSGLNLFVPVEPLNKDVVLDSVYFRGKKAKLKTNPQNPNLYIGYFEFRSGKAPDFIMSSDPKEEYGNKPPVINKKPSFELEPDEAVVSYKKDGKTAYFKITGIQERNKDEVKLKNPGSIRH